MKRALLVTVSIALGACFRFDEKLAACRDDAGVWVCGATGGGAQTGGGGAATGGGATGGGATGGGATGGGVTGGGATGGGATGGGGPTDAGRYPSSGLICHGDGGWCWEFPRPAGGRSFAAWAGGPNDLWVGTEFGLVLHRDDAGWSGVSLGNRFNVTELCGRQGTLYVGTKLDQTAIVDRAFSLSTSTRVVTPLVGSNDEIEGMDCGASALWIAHTHGVWRMPWGSSVTEAFAAPSTERCVGVLETGPGTSLSLCDSAAPARAVVRQESGASTTIFTPDASQASKFGGVDMWRGGNGAMVLGLAGTLAGEVWTLDAGMWRLTTVTPGDPLFEGAPWNDGWVAVGGPNGPIVEQQGGVVTARRVPTTGDSIHSSVAALPSGEAWVTGQAGCLLERRGDGGWELNATCGDTFLDFSITDREFLGVANGALYQRTPTSWQKVQSLSGGYGTWSNPDGGGRAVLSDSSLEYRGAMLAFTVNGARRLVVLDEGRAVVTTEMGMLLDTQLTPPGGNVGAPFNLGMSFPQVVVDRTTRTFWAHNSVQVLFSVDAGVWDDAAFTFDGGTVDDLSAAFGQVWVAAGGLLHLREDGGWRTIARPSYFGRVVVVDATRAFAYESGGRSELVSSDGTAVDFDVPPLDPDFRSEVFDGELWLLGAEGFIRHPLPP